MQETVAQMEAQASEYLRSGPRPGIDRQEVPFLVSPSF